jgi:DNA-binding XRE family transcriptional regulator
MPAQAILYSDYLMDTIPFEHWAREPVPTYDAGHRAPETCKLLGNNIRYMRMLHRWSQEALGLEAGLHRTLIGAIERAEVNTSIGTAEKIAQAFGLSVAALLTAKPPANFSATHDAFND